MSKDNARSLPFISLSPHRTIEEVQEGVSRLFESRSVVVFRTVLGIVRNIEEAEDITQEAFFRLYIELREGVLIQNTVEWVVVVAKHLALNRAKTVQRLRPITELVARAMTQKSKTVEQELVDASHYRTQLQSLERVPGTERACLELYMRGANFREISATLGLPYGEAIARTKRGIEKLRRFATEGR